MEKEWTKLEKIEAWLLDSVREEHEVKQEAIRTKTPIHLGHMAAVPALTGRGADVVQVCLLVSLPCSQSPVCLDMPAPRLRHNR